jgi:hypothetical protein
VQLGATGFNWAQLLGVAALNRTQFLNTKGTKETKRLGQDEQDAQDGLPPIRTQTTNLLSFIHLDWATETPIQENSRPTLNRTEFLNTKDTKESKKQPLSNSISDRGKSRRVLSKNSVSHDSLFPHNGVIFKLFRTRRAKNVIMGGPTGMALIVCEL